MTTLVVVPPPCPPFVTLELTFAYGSGLGLSPDPIWVADLAKYTIYIGGTTTVAGNIVSATPEFVPFGFGDCALKRVQSVLLTVKLNTQPGCTYDLKAKVASLKGTVGTATLPFSLPSLANDTPSGAIALTAGVPACGSLLCGGPTLLSTILLKYPTGSGENAKDVFFKYDAPYSGIVTVTASPSTCPGSCPTPTDVFLAVYRGSPTALEPNPSGTGDPWWNHSGSASSVTFKAQACATYYIRVSAPNTGLLPGDFKLLLSTSALVQHDLCSGAGTAGAQSVSANSSTPFDNVGAATTPGLDPTVLIVNDKWFSFLAPPGGGPVTVDTCEATWNTAVAVFGNCASILTAGAHIAYNAGGCSGSPGLGSSVTFPTVAGHTYFVCVGGQTGSASPMGCGFLHVSGGIPAPGTLPTTGGACNIKTYAIYGLPNNVGWSWSLTAPASCSPNGLNIGGTVSAISSGNALNIAHDFAVSINTAFPGSAFCPTATEIGSAMSAIAYLQIRTPCAAGAVALHVGPFCTGANCWAASATCWVNVFPSGLWVGPLGPCSFNPDIYELADENNPDADCNANGQADYADIVTGISADVDGNGVPDECQACVPVVVLDGPASTSAGLGGPASFQVQTAGSVPMTYQWRKDGLPLTGQTNAVLQLANATAADAGGYDVVISNTCAQVTSPQALLVVGPEPWLQMTLAANNVVLSWSVSEYHLQTNLALDDPTTWTDVPGDSPVTIPITDLARYFRLVAAP
jgi:hypothetical protein